MKYFIIAPRIQDAWDMQVVGTNAGNTFYFFNETEAKAALRQLKLKPLDVTIVWREEDKVLKKLASLFFNL